MSRTTKRRTTMIFRLSEELHNWLKDYAEREDRTMTDIIKEQLQRLRRTDMQHSKVLGRVEKRELTMSHEIREKSIRGENECLKINPQRNTPV
jgi:predicted DNA-binding protein